jgi:hypothetical protein
VVKIYQERTREMRLFNLQAHRSGQIQGLGSTSQTLEVKITQDGDRVSGSYENSTVTGSFTGTVESGDKIKITNLITSFKPMDNSTNSPYNYGTTSNPCDIGTFNGDLILTNNRLQGSLTGAASQQNTVGNCTGSVSRVVNVSK